MSHAEGGRRLMAADPHFHLPTRHRCHPWRRSHHFWRVWTVSLIIIFIDNNTEM